MSTAPSTVTRCDQAANRLLTHRPPNVEVLVDGDWHSAEIRMATQHEDGRWEFNVQWHRNNETRLDTFPED